MNPAEFKEHRQAKKMTQKEFALWLEVSKDTVISWENGRNKIPGWVSRRLRLDQFQIKPFLDVEDFSKAQEKAKEKGQTVEEWIADIVKKALVFTIAAAALWLLA